MDTLLFQDKLDQLIEPDVDVLSLFSDSELESLSLEQKTELVGFLSMEPILLEASNRRESFTNGVMKTHEISTESNDFAENVVTIHQSREQKSGSLLKFIPWGIAAALAVILGLKVLQPQQLPENTPPTTAKQPSGPPAIIVASNDITFANRSADDIALTIGKYTLTTGTVHMRFLNGVDLAVSAPASFEIQDGWNIVMNEGNARALVPESGHGFTINTPEMKIIDLGTEFGVSVSPNKKESEIHVFAGEVRVENEQLGKAKPLFTNDSLRIRRGEGQIESTLSSLAFPTLDSITLNNWKSWADKVLQDPDLYLFLPLTKRPQDEELEIFGSCPSDLVKHNGLQWVSGRWNDKAAALFDQDGDYLEFPIGNDVKQLTVSCWVKIDRIDYPLTSIIDTNEWPKGAWHFQYSRAAGKLFSAIKGDRQAGHPASPKLGQWTHLTMTYDKASGTSKLYVNGIPGPAATGLTTPFNPGTVRVGDWKPLKDYKDKLKRGMRGKLGELLVIKRALSDEEVSAITKAGRPSFLWNQ